MIGEANFNSLTHWTTIEWLREKEQVGVTISLQTGGHGQPNPHQLPLPPTPSTHKHLRRSFFQILGSGPEGVDDLCFHTGKFSPSPSSASSPLPTSRPISQPRGSYPGLKVQILVLRAKSQPQGQNPFFKGLSASRDVGLKTGI